MTEFPKLTYEALTVGEQFVSDTHLVTPEDIEAYAFAVDDHHPWFTEGSPFGGPVAHPTLMANQALHLRHSKYIVHAGLHAKMEFNFLEPVRPGMPSVSPSGLATAPRWLPSTTPPAPGMLRATTVGSPGMKRPRKWATSRISLSMPPPGGWPANSAIDLPLK